LTNNLKLLFRLYGQPSQAASAILDQGSLLFSSLAVVVVSVIHKPGWPASFYTALLVLAAVYVPGILLIATLVNGGGGSIGGAFRRDYSALLTCTAMAWTAANLPVALLAWLLPWDTYLILSAAAVLYFVFLMFFVVRTVFGSGNGPAVGILALSWIPLVAAAFLWGPLRYVLGWLASPFFLFFVFYYLGGELGNLGAGLRGRQHFRHMLEIAAINPHDGDAQYQLGLIYQQRRNLTEAIRRFESAVAIDPKETDAHYQLGRIARGQGRLKDALAHFQAVMDLDDHHSQSEVLRELGAVYLAARQYADAQTFLREYINRHPYDPEGLYYLGQALEAAAQPAEARAMFERAIEAVNSAPRYRRRAIAQWSRLAQRQISY